MVKLQKFAGFEFPHLVTSGANIAVMANGVSSGESKARALM
jgi:hypothetical protein